MTTVWPPTTITRFVTLNKCACHLDLPLPFLCHPQLTFNTDLKISADVLPPFIGCKWSLRFVHSCNLNLDHFFNAGKWLPSTRTYMLNLSENLKCCPFRFRALNCKISNFFLFTFAESPLISGQATVAKAYTYGNNLL